MAILETVNLCKHFGGLKAVNNVSVKVNEGEILGIIGPNGAGKTTFFNLCTGTFPSSSGKVILNGVDVTKSRSDQIAKLGLVRTFQNLKIFTQLSVLDNVKAGFHINTRTNFIDAVFHTKRYKEETKMVEEKACEILERLDMLDIKDSIAGTLAYGVQRKVEIARCLALNPKILMLDEPAAGMNPQETQSLLHFVKKLNSEGLTVIVIEHDMKFIMNVCDRIMVIVFGEKVAEGLPVEIANNPKVQEAYFGSGTFTKGA